MKALLASILSITAAALLFVAFPSFLSFLLLLASFTVLAARVLPFVAKYRWSMHHRASKDALVDALNVYPAAEFGGNYTLGTQALTSPSPFCDCSRDAQRATPSRW